MNIFLKSYSHPTKTLHFDNLIGLYTYHKNPYNVSTYILIRKGYERMIDYMPTKNASETIEALARKLERTRIYMDLKECTSDEERLKYIEELGKQIEADKKE